MFVKLRTPDDRSADYLARLYRSVRLRGYEVEPPYATVQRRIEHEALALLRAADAGVATPRSRRSRRDERQLRDAGHRLRARVNA